MALPLISLYSSLAIQPYGVCLAIGLFCAVQLGLRHRWRKQYISSDQVIGLVNGSVIAAVLGARLLHIITEYDSYRTWTDFVLVWEGGLSSWGAIGALLIFTPWFTYRHNLSLLVILDLCSIYAPLMQSISRIGCFFAGCCGGIATQSMWGIVNAEGISAHPTQLYSACLLLLIFVGMRWYEKYSPILWGQMTCIYLILISLERFMLDWIRNDRLSCSWSSLCSLHQVIALGILSIGIAGLISLYLRKCVRHEAV